MEIDGSFVRLCHLLVARDIVDSAILAEVCSCLLEVEGDIGCHALLSDVEHPFVIADTGITSGLASNSNLFTPLSIPVNRGSGVSQRGK